MHGDDVKGFAGVIQYRGVIAIATPGHANDYVPLVGYEPRQQFADHHPFGLDEIDGKDVSRARVEARRVDPLDRVVPWMADVPGRHDPDARP